MPKTKLFSKIIPLFLISVILFAACDVPDISKFTEQSSEMTSGIRKGVKETGDALELSVERKDLFTDENKPKLEQNLDEYKKAMAPTLAALNAIDAYLDALNALAQANKKSEENAKAVGSAVSSLVTTVSGITWSGSTVNIVTGLVTLAEKFKTEKDFKKRINLVADIVEGRYVEVPKVSSDGGEKTSEFKKLCTSDSKKDIEDVTKRLEKTLQQIENNKTYSKKEIEILTKSAKENADKEAYKFGCGVIDLLKFTIADLKEISSKSLKLLSNNYRAHNSVVLDFFESIEANDERVQSELTFILQFTDVISELRQSSPGDKPKANRMKTVRDKLDNIFLLNGRLKIQVSRDLGACNEKDRDRCGEMAKFLSVDKGKMKEDIYDKASASQWENSIGIIESDLESRAGTLNDLNDKYIADKNRLKPDYDAVINEIKSLDQQKKQLEEILDKSNEALDAWLKTHANLRISLDTKKPLSVSGLAGKVKELWALFNPEKK